MLHGAPKQVGCRRTLRRRRQHHVRVEAGSLGTSRTAIHEGQRPSHLHTSQDAERYRGHRSISGKRPAPVEQHWGGGCLRHEKQRLSHAGMPTLAAAASAFCHVEAGRLGTHRTNVVTRKSVKHLSRRPPGRRQHWQAILRQDSSEQDRKQPQLRLGIPLSELRPCQHWCTGPLQRNSVMPQCCCWCRCTGQLELLRGSGDCAWASCCQQATLSAQTLLANIVHRASTAQLFPFSAAGQLRLPAVVVSPGWPPSTARPPRRQTEAPGTAGA